MANGSGAGAELDRDWLDNLSDEELVDTFLSRSKNDRRAAHLCFEVIIARYHWLINHVVRNSRYRFPAWDSADDVISRVVFKVYRGLAQWRRQGKLSSFVARIASSEMIDTIRRVGRDKSWNPRQSPVDPDSDAPSPVETAPSRESSPEAQLVAREQRKIVDSLLAERLPRLEGQRHRERLHNWQSERQGDRREVRHLGRPGVPACSAAASAPGQMAERSRHHFGPLAADRARREMMSLFSQEEL